LNDSEAQAWRGLQHMVMALDAAMARQLSADTSLSYPDYVVLVALTDRRDGRRRVNDLAGELGWEQSRLSHHLRRMADRGLIDKIPCDQDRRGSWVEVTAQGRSAIRAAAPGHVELVRRLFVDLLSPAELEALADIAGRVLDHLRSDPDGTDPD
jgi:DNA-binding MarR family transcriptional regulator